MTEPKPISPIPDLSDYPGITNAYKNKKLVIFIGAGVSALWGVRRWKDLAINLIEESGLNFYEKKYLCEKYGYSPRKLITIAKNLLKETYYQELKKSLEHNEQKKEAFPELFKSIASLQDAFFVTTNIDTHLSECFFSENIVYHPSNWSKKIKPGEIVHLHGCIEKENAVMTIDEYLKHYKCNDTSSLLDSIFRRSETPSSVDDYTVLFIGYGVDELEVLDFMIQKNPSSSPLLFNSCYLLLPFFQNEEKFICYEEDYYSSLNVNVIPFMIDAIGYNQLNPVVEGIKNKLTSSEFLSSASTFNTQSNFIEKFL